MSKACGFFGAAEPGGACWREDVDAISFQLEGHSGACFVHRLALRRFLGPSPDAADCLRFFAERQAVFRGAARRKIAAGGGSKNFHLTSRDLMRELTMPRPGDSS